MEPKSSLQCAQQPFTCPYLEPDEFIPHSITIVLRTHFNIIMPYSQLLQVFSLLQTSPPKPCTNSPFLPYKPHVPLVSSSFVWSPSHYLVASTKYKAPHYAAFSRPLSLPPFKASQTSSVCVLPSMCGTKFHTHINQETKLKLCKFLTLYFWIENREEKDSGLNARRHSMNFIFLMCFTHAFIM